MTIGVLLEVAKKDAEKKILFKNSQYLYYILPKSSVRMVVLHLLHLISNVSLPLSDIDWRAFMRIVRQAASKRVVDRRRTMASRRLGKHSANRVRTASEIACVLSTINVDVYSLKIGKLNIISPTSSPLIVPSVLLLDMHS